MACKYCNQMETYELRKQIAGWLAAGKDYNSIGAILTCPYDMIIDVAQHGIGEEPVYEVVTEAPVEGIIKTTRTLKSTPSVTDNSDASITE